MNKIAFYKEQIYKTAGNFKKLQKDKVPLTAEERAQVMKSKAVWHNGPNHKAVPAVWKSVDKDGKVTYVTNTHRAYNIAPTLKGAIGRFHNFIKSTAGEDNGNIEKIAKNKESDNPFRTTKTVAALQVGGDLFGTAQDVGTGLAAVYLANRAGKGFKNFKAAFKTPQAKEALKQLKRQQLLSIPITMLGSGIAIGIAAGNDFKHKNMKKEASAKDDYEGYIERYVKRADLRKKVLEFLDRRSRRNG